ncbi:plastocyanin/azurin family copper-binding protein [Jeotgalibacillus sp. JSM ZJ347]|uniref:plastocyanin/azurin family copper-binding protein n=1 Tax=Jeotgalibacillus sp. JSM ZJ347 TaxID=3342117 RepID=UPI0035A937A7
MKKTQKRLFFPLLLLLVFTVLLVGCNANDSSEPADMSDGDTETTETAEDTMTNEEEATEETETEHDQEMDHEEATEESDQEMNQEETTDDTESANGTEEENVVTEDVASPLLAQGETAVFTFQEEGIYNIHCDPHPVMKMTVTVEEGAEIEGSIELDIADYEFSEDITVAPGTVVTWTNQDSARHNVAIEIGE